MLHLSGFVDAFFSTQQINEGKIALPMKILHKKFADVQKLQYLCTNFLRMCNG